MIREAGFNDVRQQLPIPGPSDPAAGQKEPKPLKADVIASVGDSPTKPVLVVIEGEWTHVGGAESAAQAYEYARRIKERGTLAKGAKLFDLDRAAVKRAPIHAIVVANRLLHDCMTAEQLNVELMDYFEFARHLRDRDFAELRTLAGP